MGLEVGILSILDDGADWSRAVLEHAAAKYDGAVCKFAALNPDTNQTEQVQYVDCRMPVVAETRLVSLTLSAAKISALAPLFSRLNTVVMLIDNAATLRRLTELVALMNRLQTTSTPECMLVVNTALLEAAEQALATVLGAAPLHAQRIFVMPADPTVPAQATHLIHRFISAQREAEIALLIDKKTKRRPHFNEAERIAAAHALKHKIIDAAKVVAAERAATVRIKLLTPNPADQAL